MRNLSTHSVERRLARRLPPAIWLTLAAVVAPAAAQFPDLTVADIDISPANPSPGQNITVTVTAENIGSDTPVDETVCYLYHNSPAAPNECSFDQLQLLEIAFPPNSQRIFTFTVQYPTTGQFRLWAWLDACETLIPEWNENNNNLSHDIGVGVGDLTVDSIGTNTPDPIPGEMVYTSVVVRNTGPAILAQIWRVGVVFQSAEPTTCVFTQTSDPFQGFAANSTYEVFLGPRIFEAPGTYPVWAWVDCLNDVVEASDNNNKLAGEIIIGRPDLLVDSVTPSVATPTINSQFDVSIVVRNAGSRASSAFDIAIIVDQLADPGQACPPSRGTVSPLPPGGSTTVVFPVTLTESRAYRLWGVADACDLQVEAREDNNTRSLDVNVGNNSTNAPDLVVEGIRVVEIPTPGWGAVTTFDVTVRNVGTLTSGPCRVGDFGVEFPGPYPSFVVIGSPGPSGGGSIVSPGLWPDCSWRTREIPALTPGAAAVVQFWRQYPDVGRYAFTATADVCGTPPNFNVYETSEENNRLTVEFDVAACGADADGDGVCDADDRCPNVHDPLNYDRDNDGLGDACDDDDDGDGSPDAADCEPLNLFIHSGAIENCSDGIDNNCDGQIDEGAAPLFRDADGDGYGDLADEIRDCSRSGYVTNDADCDDARADVHPGANGRCDDGIDNDCDGVIDNERTIWGRDADADGFTDPNDEIIDDDGVCDRQPAGYILASTIPDPDDDNFMVPEPVRPDPNEIFISRANVGRIDPALLALRRNGPESFTFSLEVVYSGDAQEWAQLSPADGTAGGGAAEVMLTPLTSDLELGVYAAALRVRINGGEAFDVPMTLEVRRPIITFRHAGQGGGFGYFAWYEDGDPQRRISDIIFDSRANLFEGNISVPAGTILNYELFTEGPCSELLWAVDEDGNGIFLYQSQSSDPNDADFGGVAPNDACSNCDVYDGYFTVDGDHEIAVHYVLSGAGCTSCGLAMIGLSAMLCARARPRRSGRSGSNAAR